jgi:hypothetical protein
MARWSEPQLVAWLLLQTFKHLHRLISAPACTRALRLTVHRAGRQAVLALRSLIDRRRVTGADRAAIAQASLRLLRELACAAVPPGQLMESSRVLFAFLITFRPPAASGGHSGDHEAEGGVDGDEDGVEDMEYVELNCVVTFVRLVDPVRAPGFPGVYERAAVQASVEPAGRDPSAGPSASAVAPADDVLLLLRAHPCSDHALVWSRPAASRAPPRPTLNYDWLLLTRRTADVESVRIFPPLALSRAPVPCLTRDPAGALCVNVGRGGHSGGGDDVELFLPLRGVTEAHDEHVLAQALSAAGGEGGLLAEEEAAAAARPPEEAIVVLLDVSSSMGGTAGFLDDRKEKARWVWDESQWARRFAAREERERAETAVVAEFRALPFLPLMRRLVAERRVDPLVVIEEVCRMCHGPGCAAARRSPAFPALSACRAALAAVLLAPHDGGGASTAEAEHDGVPPDLRCPITGGIMREPVVAPDGHTYEQAAIARWMHVCPARPCASPMTGAPMRGRQLVPNHNLRSQIAAWLSAGPQEEGEADGPAAGVGTAPPSDAEAAGPIPLTIRAQGLPPFTLDVRPEATVAALTGMCERAVARRSAGRLGSHGIAAMHCRGRALHGSGTASEAGLRSGDVLTVVPLPAAAAITVRVAEEDAPAGDAGGWRPGRRELVVSVRHDEAWPSLLLRVWLFFGVRPSRLVLYAACRDIGDGYVSGNRLFPSNDRRRRGGRVLPWRAAGPDLAPHGPTVELKLLRADSDAAEAREGRLSRLGAVQQVCAGRRFAGCFPCAPALNRCDYTMPSD